MNEVFRRPLQWGKGILFEKYRTKPTIKRRVVIWASGLFIVAGIAASFVSPEVRKAIDSKTGVDSSQITYRSVDVPNLDTSVKASPVSARTSGPSRKQKEPEKILGLQLVVPEGGMSIPPGTEVSAQLDAGASDGIVRVRLLAPVSVDGSSVASKGDLLLGTAASTQTRLVVRFDRLVNKDGVHKIKAMALDYEDRMPGLQGNLIGAETVKLATAVGLSFVGGYAEGLQKKEVKGGVEVKENSQKNALLNGAALAALGHSKELLGEARNAQTQIEVPDGTLLWIMFL